MFVCDRVESSPNLHSKTTSMSSSDNATKPQVYILCADQYPLYEMYEGFLSQLQRQARVQRLHDASALPDLATNPSTVFLIADDSLTKKGASRNLEAFLSAIRQHGPRVVFGGFFSSFVKPKDMQAFFTLAKIPWKQHDYLRTSISLNSDVGNHVSKTGLPTCGSTKAVLLSNVETAHVLYHAENEPLGRSLAAAACMPFGRGSLGYIGDVNAEEPSLSATFSMLGLNPNAA